MELAYRGTYLTGVSVLDGDIRQMDTTTSNGRTLLYYSTGVNGGLVTYELKGTSAAPTLLSTKYYGSSLSTMTGADLSWVSGTGGNLLFYGTTAAGDLLGYSVSTSGALQSAANYLLDDALASGKQAQLHTAGLANGNLLVTVVSSSTGKLASFILKQDGILYAGQTVSAPSSYKAGTVLLEHVTIGSATFLLRADAGLQGLSVYTVNSSTGALALKDTLGAAEGIGIDKPSALDVVQIFGKTFVLLAASGSSSISVMQMSSTGVLTATDHLWDTLDTRFGGITELASAKVGNRAFVVAAGADDGLSLFTLLPDGHLVYVQTIAHSAGSGLENIQSLTATVVGNLLEVYVSSGTGSGLARYDIDLSKLGSTVNGATSGSTKITGTTLDDMLISNSSGKDTLSGGAGDDILVSGTGSTYLSGGAGDDTFVIRPSSATQYILDYAAGDTIDLSSLPLLRSTSQLTASTTSTGINLAFGSYKINITSSAKHSLALTDIWPTLSFGGADHLLILSYEETPAPEPEPEPEPEPATPSTGLVIRGTSSAESLSGGADHDLIYGNGGNDTLHGNAGNDTIYGGDGNDKISGGAGNDLIYGGAGQNALYGDAGNDTIYGGESRDTISGGDGDDLLIGGQTKSDLRDDMYGGNGNDTLIGGYGNDLLYGDAGHDSLCCDPR